MLGICITVSCLITKRILAVLITLTATLLQADFVLCLPVIVLHYTHRNTITGRLYSLPACDSVTLHSPQHYYRLTLFSVGQ